MIRPEQGIRHLVIGGRIKLRRLAQASAARPAPMAAPDRQHDDVVKVVAADLRKIERKITYPWAQREEAWAIDLQEAHRALDKLIALIESNQVVIRDLTPITALKLSNRALNALRNAGVDTVGELKLLNDWDLVRLPSFGAGSLREVKAALAARVE